MGSGELQGCVKGSAEVQGGFRVQGVLGEAGRL